MNVVATGQQCRCPGCKATVRRLIREADSQFVAECTQCNYPLLQDIQQPRPHPLSDIEKASFTREAEANMDQQNTGETLAEKAVRMLRELKQETGRSWAELSGDLGLSANGKDTISNLIWSIGKGKVKDKRLNGIVNRIRRFRDAGPVSSEPKPSAPQPPSAPDAVGGGMPSEDAFSPARQLLEETFGLDFDELAALKSSIELLAVCRRNGTPCRLVVDEVVVR